MVHVHTPVTWMGSFSPIATPTLVSSRSIACLEMIPPSSSLPKKTHCHFLTPFCSQSSIYNCSQNSVKSNIKVSLNSLSLPLPSFQFRPWPSHSWISPTAASPCFWGIPQNWTLLLKSLLWLPLPPKRRLSSSSWKIQTFKIYPGPLQ
jgi:hypothetical protein